MTLENGSNLVVDLNHETESVPLKLIFVVERLDDFERTSSVVIADHGELIGAESAALDHLLKGYAIKFR